MKKTIFFKYNYHKTLYKIYKLLKHKVNLH